jgi:hypothetical protein
MMKFAKLEMKAPSGLSMRVEVSKQTREAKEKKRKMDSKHVTPGVGVQRVRAAVREAVREELTSGGEDNLIRKQTRKALCDESKEGGVLTAAAARGAASLQRGMRALEKALQMQQAAQMMAVQQTYGGQQWHGYHTPYAGMSTAYAMRDTSNSDGEWRRPEEEERRGGGASRGRQHSWGEGQQLGREGGASKEDLEAVIATLQTPGGPEALRRLAGNR